MAKRIVYSENALADRADILEYWYNRIGTKTYSKKLDKSFKEIIKLFSKYPVLGRQLKNQSERVFIKDAYQIFYTFDHSTIKILHLWDTRRNPSDIER